MNGRNQPPQRILIASANPLFSKGLQRLFAEWWKTPTPEVRLVSSMGDTLAALRGWMPELVVVDYDDRTINRAEFLNHFVEGNTPMQVLLVSLQESGEVVVYDRRTMTPAEVQTWFHSVPARPAAIPASIPSLSRMLLQPRWILLTLLMLAAAVIFIRLGFWQLDRLAERRGRNAQIRAEIQQPPLDLNAAIPAGFEQMEYRTVTATGVFDFDHEVLLRNQAHENRLGDHLLTPLRLENGTAILVDRGWIPNEESSPSARQKYAQTGSVTITGMLRKSQAVRGAGQVGADGFTSVNLDAIRQSTGADLLPMFIIQAPDPAAPELPFRSLPAVELTEGPHLGYALQWFFFALIVLVGYPFLILRQLRDADRVETVVAGAPVKQKPG
ncbi:MAG TPA: SURF1 family protein [Anaerolineaceae bacterium]